MPDVIPKPSHRDGSGPRAPSNVSDQERGCTGANQRLRSGGRSRNRPRRNDSHRSSKIEPDHGQRRRLATHQVISPQSALPVFELDTISQPARNVPFGVLVDTAVMVSLRCPAPGGRRRASSIDTSSLCALTSLVVDTREGGRVPLETGSMTGQNICDSIHAFPGDVATHLDLSQPCRVALGRLSFPNLLIRQSGVFRLRTTLLQLGQNGATTLVAIDSDPIRVERRGTSNI